MQLENSANVIHCCIYMAKLSIIILPTALFTPAIKRERIVALLRQQWLCESTTKYRTYILFRVILTLKSASPMQSIVFRFSDYSCVHVSNAPSEYVSPTSCSNLTSDYYFTETTNYSPFYWSIFFIDLIFPAL